MVNALLLAVASPQRGNAEKLQTEYFGFSFIVFCIFAEHFVKKNRPSKCIALARQRIGEMKKLLGRNCLGALSRKELDDVRRIDKIIEKTRGRGQKTHMGNVH